MITIYLIVSLWIPGHNPVPLEMTRQADLAECLNGVAKVITDNDDIAMPDGTKDTLNNNCYCFDDWRGLIV